MRQYKKFTQVNSVNQHRYYTWAMWEIVGTVALFFIVYLTITFYIRPKRQYNRLVHHFQAKGYKVHTYPFRCLRAPAIEQWQYNYKKYGDSLKTFRDDYPQADVVISNVLSQIAVEFVKPSLLKQFFSLDNVNNYYKIKQITEGFDRMGKGLIFSEGEQWKKKRKILNKVFNFQFVKNLSQKIAEICDQQIEEFEKKGKNAEGEYRLPLLDLASDIAGNVVMEGFLGGDASDLKIDGSSVCKFTRDIIGHLTKTSIQILPMFLGQWFCRLGVFQNHRMLNREVPRHNKWGEQYVKKRIKEEKEKLCSGKDSHKNPSNMIEAILRCNLESQATNKDQLYTSKEIFEQFNVFFVAGSDTTSHFITMMMYYICRDRKVYEKTRREVQEFMKDDDYSFENLKNMKYIDMVQKEVTRYYGPVNGTFFRESQKDHFIDGIPIRKGNIVSAVYIGNHWNPSFFQNPGQFLPQRWEHDNKQLPTFAFGGFGNGQRTCIGKPLALLESKIAVIKLFKRYKELSVPETPLRFELKLMYSPSQFPLIAKQ